MVHYRNETINKAKTLEALALMMVEMYADLLTAGAPPDSMQLLMATSRYRLSDRIAPLGYTEDQIDEELIKVFTKIAERDSKNTSHIREAVGNMRKNSVAYGELVKENGDKLKLLAQFSGSNMVLSASEPT